MGQKVSPIGLRVGVIRDWESRWYAEEEYGDLLLEDVKIREAILNKYKKEYSISRVEIERNKNSVNVIIRTSRPGMLTGGKDGDNKDPEINKLTAMVKKIIGDKSLKVKLVEIGNPDLDARLVALKIVKMLEERQSFRTAQKKAIQQTMRAGAKGIKTAVSGRLGGADIARSEGYSEGVVPLHTLRSDIDYAWEEAMTTYGKLGVKVWICRGEVLPGEMVKEPERASGKGNDKRRNDRRPNRAAKPANKEEAPVKQEAPAENVNNEAVESKEDE